MSLEAILAELPELTEEEREAIEHKLYELSHDAVRSKLRQWESEPPLPVGYWKEVFKDWTSQCKEDMPGDFALNHDHYIHGRPKEW
ncbi:MAG TPA: hypothetical protein VGN43_05335 [Steroidobacteraceae bacterium]|jgi:hypothetical protein|nr:hypothetical protein [Steroidobacteraceae bacterium]